MLKLTRTGIRNMASNDFVYSRGVNYYKKHHVVSASYSNKNKQYRIVVKGNNNYIVQIKENEDGSFQYSCNCPDSLKQKGACKHIVAALMFVMKYQEQTLLKEPMTQQEKTIYHILDYFERQEDIFIGGDIYRIEPTITIPSMYHEDDRHAYLILRAGNEKMYKVQSLKRFLIDYSKNETIILGKEFKFIADESEFDRSSQKLIEFLLEILDIQDAFEQSSSKNIFTKSQMMLSKRMLKRVFRILDHQVFRLELYGRTYEDVRYVKGNPKLHYDITVQGMNSIALDCKEGEHIIPLMETGELLYYKGVVYQPDTSFIKNYLPFYNSLGGNKEPLVFEGCNREKFLESILPKINHTLCVNIPEELKDLYVHEELKSKIYFDKYNRDIKAEVRFQYGEFEFNAFESGYDGSHIIVRQKEKEEELLHLLEQMEFESHKNFFLLKNDRNIYTFLKEGMDQLKEQCEVFYSEDFKKIGIRTSGNFKTNLRLSSDMNLLEFDIENDDIPKEELEELFKSFRLKKKYYRLKNGDFIDLESKHMEEMTRILDRLNISNKELNTDTLRLSKNTAVYLNEVLEEAEIETLRSQNFLHFIDTILNPEDTEYEVPDVIQATLRHYQLVGFRWMRMLAGNGLGGILADDMGLGKTLQSIVYMASVLEEESKAHFLIVCPTSLVYNWKEEVEKFAPHLACEIVTGSPKERQVVIGEYENYNILITSYPLIRRDIELYETIMFHTVFIDEAQFIKNADSLSAQSVKRLKTVNRFALTGTPIENSLSELWSIFDYLMPYYLLTHSKFVSQYEKPILRNDKEVLEDLGKHIRPFILRRMKKEVLTELPDKIETKMLMDMKEEQKKVYSAYLESIRGDLGLTMKENGMEQSRMKILAALTRLRQICCHPSTFLEEYNGGSGKLDVLMEVVPEAIANDHRILIFSQFTSMLHIIGKELEKQNITYFSLEGSTPTEVRADYVKRFNAGECSVFLISLKAGGTGLNLVGADMVIHYDPWWNPAVEEQATDRAYRIGQKNSVQVLRLITKGTIEEKIFKLQQRKKDLSDTVIQTKEIFINTLTREELEELFL